MNQILDTAGFDDYVEALCQRFYADEIGRPLGGAEEPFDYVEHLVIGLRSVYTQPQMQHFCGHKHNFVLPCR